MPSRFTCNIIKLFANFAKVCSIVSYVQISLPIVFIKCNFFLSKIELGLGPNDNLLNINSFKLMICFENMLHINDVT